MARPVILGNGSLTVGLNEQGLVHDFYFPYVGLENLTTSRSIHHKIGVWVDQTFSWIDDGSWNVSVDFDSNALVSKISMHSEALGIEISTHDFVDSELNAFIRNMKVKNNASKQRDIRLFMHQVFQISSDGRADTALFEPEENYILDYKGRCSLAIYGELDDHQTFDQYAVGSYGIEGKEGTYRDAEDGELSGCAVEHGGVDSVIRFLLTIEPGQSTNVNYWIVAADSQYNAERIHKYIKQQGVESRLEITKQHWSHWLATADKTLAMVDNHYHEPVKKSLMLIKAHIDKRGGIIASCDSSIYNYGRDYYSYVWPRDGAFAIWPLIRLGFVDEAKRFFKFCRDIITPEGYLMHKYQPDRAIGSTWHPLVHGKHKELAIQEDETAIIIYMLGEYYAYTKDEEFIRNLYVSLIKPSADFMKSYVDESTGLPHASYDLWEEKFLTNTYTAFLVYQSLQVASDFASKFEFLEDSRNWRDAAENIMQNCEKLFDSERNVFIKGFLLSEDGELSLDKTLDVSSLYGVMMFGDNDSKEKQNLTVEAIESILLDKSPSGGAPRYEHDKYFETDPAFMGNPWIVTTLWLAQYYARNRQLAKARDLIDWTLGTMLPSGVLSEQIHPSDSSPISVAPLIWSHAELINTIVDISVSTE